MNIQGLAKCILTLICLALLLASTPVLAEGFQVETLQAKEVDGVYRVEASIEYAFSDKALEALQSGVPLTLEVHLQLRRKGAWLWTSDLVDKRLRYQIRYQALAEVYQVLNLQSQQKQSFATREVAMNALGTLSNIELVIPDQLAVGVDYNLAMRARLDIESLPLPLRPMAYLSAAWNLTSEWKVWLLKR